VPPDTAELARIRSGKIVLNVETLALRQDIDCAIETSSTQLEDKQQTIEVLMPGSITLEADALRLRQVLINLISNASKFSPPQSKIWIKSTVEGDEAVVRVEDRGRGIPSELLPHIFELFTQAAAPPRDQAAHSGLGLGLTLVKNFVELHHGTVQARSEGVDKGAETSIRLPLKQPVLESDEATSDRLAEPQQRRPL
jgi:signal transduction histidine kinase